MPSPNLSRVTRAYVSGYDRSRVVVGQVRRQETRTITADFNGLLAPGETIESVTWRCNSPWVLSMSAAAVADDGRSVSVLAAFQFGGFAALKATVLTSTANKYSQQFEYTVRDSPIFTDENAPTTGPYSLTAVAA